MISPLAIPNDLTLSELFQRYSAMLNTGAWELALTALYATRSYEAGLDGSRMLAGLCERFKDELGPERYQNHLIRIALLELTCLDRMDWIGQYLDRWEEWRARPLGLYYKLSRRNNVRMRPYVLEELDTRIWVHFLYFQQARKRTIERKAGSDYRPHAGQSDLSDEEIKDRLRNIR